jgi:predicted SAM-dependent methyltransferase
MSVPRNFRRLMRPAYSNLVRGRLTFQPSRHLEHARYLNAGCGQNLVPGFVNLDWTWRRGLDLCWDLTKRLPFADAQLDGVFTEHALEHLKLAATKETLNEFRRILRPGGILRVVLPDAGLYLRLYHESRRSGHVEQFPYESDPPTALTAVNRIYFDYGHQYMYDVPTITLHLREAGFREVNEVALGEGSDPRLLIDDAARAPESLYVEAMR